MKTLLSIIFTALTISACKPSSCSSPSPSQPLSPDKPPVPTVVEPTPLKRTLDSMVDKTVYSVVHKGTTAIIIFTDNTQVLIKADKYTLRMYNIHSK